MGAAAGFEGLFAYWKSEPWFGTAALGGKRQSFGDQEAIGGDAQGSVMMETAPATAFVVAEPGKRSPAFALFEFEIVAFDPPA